MSTKNKLIVILGPTGSGKTEMAIKQAKKLNGEIVSADSRQIYKGMTIATAKPDKEQLKAIKHYLIDIIRPDEKFNVAIYKKLATKAIKNIYKKGKLPFLVGGTGLYLSSIIDNIDFPQVAPQKKLRDELEEKTIEQLFKIYKKLDPSGSKFIDKQNKRRLIRAIEVCKITKKSFWELKKKKEPLFDILNIGIEISKKDLEKRITKRVNKMFKYGLEKEAMNLIKKYTIKIPSMQTIGYQEWSSFKNNPKDKKEEINRIKDKIITHTLQFTKKQITWFKKTKEIKWVKNNKEAEKTIREFLKK